MDSVSLRFHHHCIFTEGACPVRDEVVVVEVPVNDGVYVYPKIRCAKSHHDLRPIS